MKKYTISMLLFVSCFFSCGSYESESSSMDKAYDTSASEEVTVSSDANDTQEPDYEATNYTNIISSSLTQDLPADSGKRFVIDGEIKFKTTSVFKATQNIEKITMRSGGYVQHTHLDNQLVSKISYRASEDSIVQITESQMENQFILRVPNSKLDTLLEQLVPLIKYLDHRILSKEDVTLQMMSEQLQIVRNKLHYQRVDDNIESTDDNALQKEEAMLKATISKDEAMLKKMKIKDQIKYSTLALTIYEDISVLEEKKPYITKYKRYTPSYGSKIADGISDGIEAIKTLFIGIVTIWPLWVLLVIAFFIYRRIVRK